jgi:predicted amidohydrolase YtcJ
VNADLILMNGRILTMDPSLPRASMISIQGNRIAYVTRDKKIKDLKGTKTKVIDLRNKCVLPGFHDAHCHIHALAESFITPSLNRAKGIRSIAGIQEELKKISRNITAGSWIKAGGYHEFYLEENRHPSRWELDAVSLINPIRIIHQTGYAHVLNSLALNLIGISRETPDPPNGIIDRDLNSGEPTGLLYGMGDFLAPKIPPINTQDLEAGIKQVNQELLSMGITSVQDASPRNNIQSWQMLQGWKTRGILKSRVCMMLGIQRFQTHFNHSYTTMLDCDHLCLGAVKIMVNETTGQVRPYQKELDSLVFEIHQAGFQVSIHAIEQPAIETACTALEYALRKSPRANHRHRIEHCSICPPILAKRLASLGITVVTQPAFIYYSGGRYLQTIPAEQLAFLYPIATLLKHKINVAGSSDCPVIPANPLKGIFAATCRRSQEGEIILPEERITVEEALRMFTINPASAVFQESRKGTISPGKLADLVILNEDPTQLPQESIPNLNVEMTILDGQVVWEK